MHILNHVIVLTCRELNMHHISFHIHKGFSTSMVQAFCIYQIGMKCCTRRLKKESTAIGTPAKDLCELSAVLLSWNTLSADSTKASSIGGVPRLLLKLLAATCTSRSTHSITFSMLRHNYLGCQRRVLLAKPGKCTQFCLDYAQ